MKENEKKNNDLANYILAGKEIGSGIDYLEEAIDEISCAIKTGGKIMEEEMEEKFAGRWGIQSLDDSLSKLEDILNELYEYSGGIEDIIEEAKSDSKD